MIGIMGANGAVGSAAARLLQDQQVKLGSLTQGARVDASSKDSLCSFMEGCDVVLNCIGPSCEFSQGIANAAVDANVPLVDVAGEAPLAYAIDNLKPEIPLIIGAGMLPGLSGLALRYLVDISPAAKWGVTAFSGGLQSVSPAASRDLIASVAEQEGYGLGGCALRNGEIAQAPRSESVPPQVYPAGSTAYPFLTEEARALAGELHIQNLTWSNVLVGDAMKQVMTHLQGADKDEAAVKLQLASKASLVAAQEFYAIVLASSDDALVITAIDGYGLTAQVAVLALRAILDGIVDAGAHFACDVLNPARVLRAVDDAGFAAVSQVRPDALYEAEEGAL